MLKDVRLAFHRGLFNAIAFTGDGKADYNCKFIFPPDHPATKLIEAAEAEVAKEKWGAKWEKELAIIRSTGNAVVRDGNLQRADGFEGNCYINVRSQIRPGVFNRDRSPLTEADGVVYSGCYVNAKIEVWAMDNQYGKKINAQLLGVQFARDGDSFGGGKPSATADDFEDVADSGEDPFA
jgi:hypothetical protein